MCQNKKRGDDEYNSFFLLKIGILTLCVCSFANSCYRTKCSFSDIFRWCWRCIEVYLQPKLLHSPIQSRPRDTKLFGGVTDIALVFVECRLDCLFFEIVKVKCRLYCCCGRRRRRYRLLRTQTKIIGRERCVGGHNDSSLHTVLQFTNITSPLMMLEGSVTGFRNVFQRQTVLGAIEFNKVIGKQGDVFPT